MLFLHLLNSQASFVLCNTLYLLLHGVSSCRFVHFVIASVPFLFCIDAFILNKIIIAFSSHRGPFDGLCLQRLYRKSSPFVRSFCSFEIEMESLFNEVCNIRLSDAGIRLQLLPPSPTLFITVNVLEWNMVGKFISSCIGNVIGVLVRVDSCPKECCGCILILVQCVCIIQHEYPRRFIFSFGIKWGIVQQYT